MTTFAHALLAHVATPCMAYAQGAIQPGEYLDGSGGYLIIRPATGGSHPFTLDKKAYAKIREELPPNEAGATGIRAD